jgi:hypothetical protein
VTSASASAGASAPVRFLLGITDTVAAVLLAADLAVVIVSVTLRSLFNAPVEWSDDVARGLMVGSSFFGAASALARGENVGVAFFVDRCRRTPPHRRCRGCAADPDHRGYVAWHAIEAWLAHHRTDHRLRPAAGMTFYPMGAGAACMAAFALDQFARRDWRDVFAAIASSPRWPDYGSRGARSRRAQRPARRR